MRTVLMLVVLLANAGARASEQPAAQQPASQEEISVLRAEIAELRTVLFTLQAAQPRQEISIGVMPIENAWSIPQVGNAFRQVLISTLNEVGIRAVESLDDETLRWVQRQDQLVRERWIDPLSAPPRGELRGVTHYLLGIVTRYQEEDVEDIRVLAGILVLRFGGEGRRIRTGSLVVDFRIVDARTGVALDSFRTEAAVRKKESGKGWGSGWGYSGGWGYPGWYSGGSGSWRYHRQAPLPEIAARACAQQAAERIAGLFNPAPTTAQPAPTNEKK